MARLVPAVARGFDILELFLDSGEPLSAPEICARLDLPRTSVHELISTLVARSYLVSAPGQPHRYQLGIRVFQLGSTYAEQMDLAQLGQEVAREVAAQCDETVHLAILDGTDVTYIAKVDSTHTVRMVSAVGHRVMAHCTAVGKMLLSSLSKADLDAAYPTDAPLTPMTPGSLTSREELDREILQIRRHGLAYDNSESNPAVACVAAPVYDYSATMVAALSISVPTVRWSAEKQEEWGHLVSDGARNLSMRLGYRGHRS